VNCNCGQKLENQPRFEMVAIKVICHPIYFNFSILKVFFIQYTSTSDFLTSQYLLKSKGKNDLTRGAM
jgi:hypothetical protein